MLISLKIYELELYIAEESHCNVNKSAILLYHKANGNHAISNNELPAHPMQKSLGHAAEAIEGLCRDLQRIIPLTWGANILVFLYRGRQKY